MKKIVISITSCIAAAPALAHPGHGMPGEMHWHATDAAGLVFVGVAALAAIWFANR